MTPFLQYVAHDIINRFGTQLADIAVVFPNKRASLFFNTYLVQEAGKPIWSPAYITISELFRKHSSLEVADHIELVCRLYNVWRQHTSTPDRHMPDTIDHFYGWGELLLADFDDIDKNLGNAGTIFTDLSDYHELTTAPADMLDDEQKEQLHRLFGYFAETKSELKERFNMLWGKLAAIYNDFRTTLRRDGLAYEGMLYRDVAEAPSVNFQYRHYVFVGFNMMQRAEQQLFTRLKNQGKASFYWDFDKYYVDNAKAKSEAGIYIAEYLGRYGNSLDITSDDIYGNMSKHKDITYISAQTENIQARYIRQWLKENGRAEAARRTAIVLADERLLPSVVDNLPSGISVNITTGYPLALSPAASMLRLLLTLRHDMSDTGTQTFRRSTVNRLLAHPYAKYISPKADDIRQTLNAQHLYHPTCDDMQVDEGTNLLFCQPNDPTDISETIQWITNVIEYTGKHSTDSTDPFFQESLFRTYTLCNRLKRLITDHILSVNATTLERLLSQIVASTTVPFHGEPAEGVQIMGVLETRNLDFDHVLLLSCNEGNMPKAVTDTSFIPYSIRKFHGLTTIDNKTAIYAYYFYRLMQRAGDITMTYNTTTEGTHTSEMSRFMLQMLVDSLHTVSRLSICAGQSPCDIRQTEVEKNTDVMARMLKPKPDRQHVFVSPTALGTYLACPMRYYYAYVAGLNQDEETDDDSIDARMFGNIFHSAAHLLYKDSIGKTLNKDDIKRLYGKIDLCVNKAFIKELYNKDPDTTSLGALNGLQQINSKVIKLYLQRLLKGDADNAPITILGTEQWVMRQCRINVDGTPVTIAIGGIIDRIDRIGRTGQTRIVDYKTGRPPKTMPASLDDIFDPTMNKTIPANYYLQTMLYSSIVKEEQPNANVVPSLIYIQHTPGEHHDPTLTIGGQPITDISHHDKDYRDMLTRLLEEIYDPTQPFIATPDTDRCLYCPFAQMCR